MSEGRETTIREAIEKKVICRRCQIDMEPKKVFFDYLGHNFHTDILCCPQCGEVYVPEKLVKGRMAEVERELEDK